MDASHRWINSVGLEIYLHLSSQLIRLQLSFSQLELTFKKFIQTTGRIMYHFMILGVCGS